jgi:hypothetical protein
MLRALRATLVFLLLPTLAFAGTGPAASPLGFVANERASNVISGLTLFDGNRVSTESQGHAAVLFTSTPTKLFVPPYSTVTLSGVPDKPTVILSRGAVRFSNEEGGSVRIKVGGVLIEPHGPATVNEGEVRLVAARRISVATVSAPLRVTLGEESLVVPKGSVYTLEIAPEPQGPQGQGAPAAIKGRRLGILMAVMMGATIGVGIYLYNREDRGTTAVVSPFVP